MEELQIGGEKRLFSFYVHVSLMDLAKEKVQCEDGAIDVTVLLLTVRSRFCLMILYY